MTDPEFALNYSDRQIRGSKCRKQRPALTLQHTRVLVLDTPAALLGSSLFEKSVHLDLASRPEIHTTVNNYWDDEARRQGSAIARPVLF
jgi:hypothetical protein